MPATHRRERLRSAFPHNVDAIALTDRINVLWGSGFSGSTGALLIPVDPTQSDVFATDGRYTLRAVQETEGLEILETRQGIESLLWLAGERGMRRVGVEADHISLSSLRRLEAVAADHEVGLVPLPDLVEPLRRVKDADEIAALRLACEITDAAFEGVLGQLRPGLCETEIEWRLLTELHNLHAEGPAFDPIVASGPNGAIPHHRPSGRVLGPGDLLTLDFGAKVGGHHADMTRTVVIGPPSDWQRDVYALVRSIQEAGCRAARGGVVPKALNDQAATTIEAAGHSASHGLGHGVGLEIHEAPWLTPESVSPPLQPFTTFTIEPGIYVGGLGGVRIEDTLIVDASGDPQRLTCSSRELIEV